MRSLYLLGIICITSAVAAVHADPPPPPSGYRWVPDPRFSDEFAGNALDLSKWYDHHPTWEGRPPAKFMPDTVSVDNGMLQITNRAMEKPDGAFSIAGGAVVSRSSDAHYGYYEVRMKASSISMSSTFWFSNQPDRNDPLNSSQELDVQEAVGRGKQHPDRRHFMNSNTHYWMRAGGKRSKLSAGQKVQVRPPVDETFHTYGVWWVDARTARFYHNDKYVYTIHPRADKDASPFDRSMQLNLVTETYNWETPPTTAELADDSRNTTYYDWVRAYTLRPADCQ